MEKQIVNFRMTREEKRRLKKKADQMGMSLSAYIRYIATLKVDGRLADKENK
jgi:hypothetical protein